VNQKLLHNNKLLHVWMQQCNEEALGSPRFETEGPEICALRYKVVQGSEIKCLTVEGP